MTAKDIIQDLLDHPYPHDLGPENSLPCHYPLQGLERQQSYPRGVDDDNDPQQRWREAYHRRLNNNPDPIPSRVTGTPDNHTEPSPDKVNH